MAAFAYSAINAQGLVMDGVLSAPDPDAARDQLRAQGLLAQRLEQTGEGEAGDEASGQLGKRVNPRILQIFSRQFATMIEAGLSVVSALTILEEQTVDKRLAEVVTAVREQVESGSLLSEALASHPKVFSRLYVAMVEAGEAAGVLDQVLDRIAYQIEKETQIKRRVKSAMTYPIVVIVFATLVLTGMLLFIVPIFVGHLQEPERQAADADPDHHEHVGHAPRGLVHHPGRSSSASSSASAMPRGTEPGRQMWDRFKLRVPFKIGDTVRKVSMARFSRTLATLVGAGVDIIKGTRDHEVRRRATT